MTLAEAKQIGPSLAAKFCKPIIVVAEAKPIKQRKPSKYGTRYATREEAREANRVNVMLAGRRYRAKLRRLKTGTQK